MFERSDARKARAATRIPPTCRNCGDGPLRWMATEQGYRLYTSEGVIHVCFAAPLPGHKRIAK